MFRFHPLHGVPALTNGISSCSQIMRSPYGTGRQQTDTARTSHTRCAEGDIVRAWLHLRVSLCMFSSIATFCVLLNLLDTQNVPVQQCRQQHPFLCRDCAPLLKSLCLGCAVTRYVQSISYGPISRPKRFL